MSRCLQAENVNELQVDASRQSRHKVYRNRLLKVGRQGPLQCGSWGVFTIVTSRLGAGCGHLEMLQRLCSSVYLQGWDPVPSLETGMGSPRGAAEHWHGLGRVKLHPTPISHYFLLLVLKLLHGFARHRVFKLRTKRMLNEQETI